jgi:hypothetical protein
MASHRQAFKIDATIELDVFEGQGPDNIPAWGEALGYS